MKCSRCGGACLVESLGPNTSKATCQTCGHADITNAAGQRFLTDERVPQPARSPRPLTEG